MSQAGWNPYDAETEHIFRRGTFGTFGGFGSRPAAVVVDFCLGMTDPASPLGSDMTDAITASARLLAGVRAGRWPVIFTTVRYARGCVDGAAFLRKVPALRIFEEGGPWSSLDQRLEPQPDEIVLVKQYASAFFGTPLVSLLTSQRVDTVIVVGATTSGCVRATAVDALQHGFQVVVPIECVADRAPGPHVSSLFDLQQKYADVISLEETLTALARLAPER